mmetsp:Transcript_75733/g.105152  ORF Transcript_75733/g.105152 Transcript_75733/m.105152 type:complete len:120 (-) Transcript_75733:46-405(-)
MARACDIFSAGVTLFSLLSGGFPYLVNQEEHLFDGCNLKDMVLNGDENYWRVYEKANPIVSELSDEFKDLFFGMTCQDPTRRLDIEQVINHKWVQDGDVYNDDEVIEVMRPLFEQQQQS